MRFSEALEHVYDGKRIHRAGWNGKNMYVFLGRCSPNAIQGAPLTVSAPDCEFLCMFNAKRHIVVGWLASQEDMLADDWAIIS